MIMQMLKSFTSFCPVRNMIIIYPPCSISRPFRFYKPFIPLFQCLTMSVTVSKSTDRFNVRPEALCSRSFGVNFECKEYSGNISTPACITQSYKSFRTFCLFEYQFNIVKESPDKGMSFFFM